MAAAIDGADGAPTEEENHTRRRGKKTELYTLRLSRFFFFFFFFFPFLENKIHISDELMHFLRAKEMSQFKNLSNEFF